ncbi:PREDICTED: N-terminal Xaa-Pro-Lys N-methyltransferase 1 [Charadrius vociferus]|nr:PREDICTED: N-terminal Xaa-Pro-Lys N-methyltransferase 1 [Charadrius vociferus]XP_009886310.1 PREDICTED: N-terminal Xaa-Pro-Lys N-methyltransferase 1 [Charadrius vociferus]XP_009886311.1 PREDICTED: N-terminal Xaa-Pro-Lys N-methyltransferase 1 [Charadrius vociferus]
MTSEVVENEFEFYSKAEKYWKDVPATVDGMLGGYGHISSIDINSSRKFLQRFLRDGPNRTGTTRALDCGAGIGRITKRLLLPLFKTVDMVDVTEDFLTKAKSYLGEEGRRVRNYFCCGLQDFSPEPNSYDVIWIQWVIGHLTDNHLSDFLKRCRAGLRPNGIVVIKDNMAQEGVIMDDVDSSVCRDLDVVRKIIRRAGLHLLAEERQENFPDEIYHVYTFAMSASAGRRSLQGQPGARASTVVPARAGRGEDHAFTVGWRTAARVSRLPLGLVTRTGLCLPSCCCL